MIWGPCAKKILVVLMNSALANPQAASSLNLCLFQSMATAFFITLHINLLTNPAGSIFILYRVRTLCMEIRSGVLIMISSGAYNIDRIWTYVMSLFDQTRDKQNAC